MKVLILSCSTGQGHNAAGLALLEEFQRRGTDCRMLDTLTLAGEQASRRISEAYVRLTTRFPQGFEWLYKAGGALSSARRKSPVYLANISYAGRLLRLIEKEKYDRVVTPHLFPAEALTHLRRSDGLKVPCFAVATDYTCIPFWEETELDSYFIPHKDLAAEFAGRGLPEEKLIPTGIPVSARYHLHTPKAEARAALSLPESGPIYLVMTGSMGFGSAAELTEKLLALPGHICVMGGHNEALKAELRARFDRSRVSVLDFTDQVPLYMDACDLLFTKPGGLTSTEAAVRGIPLVHTAPIPGCETCNAGFFAEREMSVCALTPDEACEAAEKLADPAAREAMLAAQRREINPCAAADICDRVLS